MKQTNPLPWTYRGNRIRDNNGQDVAFLSCNPAYIATLEDKANAAFIVKACNNYEALVFTIQDFLDSHVTSDSDGEKARKKAKDLLNKLNKE